MGYICHCGAEYTTGLEVNLLDKGIDRYFGISRSAYEFSGRLERPHELAWDLLLRCDLVRYCGFQSDYFRRAHEYLLIILMWSHRLI